MMLALGAALAAVSVHPVALTVSPARAVLLAPASRTLQVDNLGRQPVTVDVAWSSVGGFGAPNRWLSVTPRHLVVRNGARALVSVRAGPGASPGDHEVLVFVTGRPVSRGRVAVELRVGVRVRVRAQGRLVRRVAVEGVRARRFKRKRILLVAVANHGNVTEQLRDRLTVTLVSHNRPISRLRLGRSRELYPGARGVVALPYAGRARGFVTALVTVRLGAQIAAFERRYRLLL